MYLGRASGIAKRPLAWPASGQPRDVVSREDWWRGEEEEEDAEGGGGEGEGRRRGEVEAWRGKGGKGRRKQRRRWSGGEPQGRARREGGEMPE